MSGNPASFIAEKKLHRLNEANLKKHDSLMVVLAVSASSMAIFVLILCHCIGIIEVYPSISDIVGRRKRKELGILKTTSFTLTLQLGSSSMQHASCLVPRGVTETNL